MSEAAEAEAPEADFDAEFEAAREAEGLEPEASEFDEETGEPKPKADAKAPLPTEEVTKRWNDTKAALKQERAERRALQARLEALEARHSAPAPKTEAAADQGPPDPEIDPIGALKWGIEQAKRATQGDAEAIKAQAEAAKAQAERQKLVQWAAEEEADFIETTPDYKEAFAHFAKTRQEELKDEGHANPGQAFAQEMEALMKRAQGANKNPAEVIYKLSQRRGFGVDKGGKALEQISRGQAANRSLSGSGGRPAAPALTPGNVANLKGAAFDAAFEKLRAQERSRRA